MLALPRLRLLTWAWRRGNLQAAAGRPFCAAAQEEDGPAGQGQQQQRPPLDPGLLELLACPLSKKPLRYKFWGFSAACQELPNEQLRNGKASFLDILLIVCDPQPHEWDMHVLEHSICRYEESTSELINEELGIAYPIIDGIPHMIPQAARMIGKENQEKEPEQT